MAELYSFIRRWADEEYWNGHLLSTAIGFWGPDVEANIALGSLSQDDLGHARMLYGTYLQSDESINRHIFLTEPDHYEAQALALAWEEADWTFVVVKEFLYKEADQLRLHLIRRQANAGDDVMAFLRHMADEENLHIKHWREWLRLLGNSEEGKKRLQEAWKRLYPYALSLVDSFSEMIPNENVTSAYIERLKEVIKQSGLNLLLAESPAKRDRLSPEHRRNFEQICNDMQSVFRSDPLVPWG
jgi:ring-1,2-phenylacetyl-CoA epoxidase subunit PaaC